MTADIVQFIPARTKVRSQDELRQIGLKIIASSEFQAGLVDSEKDDTIPYCPIAVAVMRGYYEVE